METTTQAVPSSVKTMRAAVLVEPGRFAIRDVSIPAPGANQVLVRIEGCGVCASNIPPFEGREWFKYPMEPGQLGHEAWGRVVALGAEVTSFRVGDRVAFLSNHAYAEFDVADVNQVVSLPAALDERPFPAEPLGCALNIFERSGIQAGQSVAIVGIGFLGALLVQLVKKKGARVIALGRREFALSLARQMGADETLSMDDYWKAIERVRDWGGSFCDVVVECVGKEYAVNLSAELTRERGRLVIAGYHQDGMRSVNLQLWNWRGLDVINAHERDPAIYLRGMQRAVEATVAGEIDPSSLFTHTFPLERLGEALQMTKDRPDGFMKALVNM